MYTLTYESKAVPNLTNAQVEDILKTARAFNSQNGITGCLVFYLNGFIQILEGPKEKVTELYRRIENDPRHTRVNLFSEDEITERNFPDWGMAYYPISENSLGHAEFLQFKRNLRLLADLSKPTNVTAILFWKRMKFLISSPPKRVK
ncbi:BLUF domain-containing protein [Pseudozobellia thermophila]|nr:BLUF domain-containing protein [Pseudozobellia thermophila]